MLTVKRVLGPEEEIVACKYVTLGPDGREAVPANGGGDYRILYAMGANDDGSARMFDHGVLYVMNESGATIARYHLGYYGLPTAGSQEDGGTSLKAA